MEDGGAALPNTYFRPRESERSIYTEKRIGDEWTALWETASLPDDAIVTTDAGSFGTWADMLLVVSMNAERRASPLPIRRTVAWRALSGVYVTGFLVMGIQE